MIMVRHVVKIEGATDQDAGEKRERAEKRMSLSEIFVTSIMLLAKFMADKTHKKIWKNLNK